MADRLPAEAFILCGGQSVRFGAQKARYALDGTPLVKRIYQLLDSVFEKTVLVCKQARDYQDLGMPLISDQYPIQAPMAGLLTALNSTNSDWIFVSACDLTDLSESFVRWLWHRRADLGVVPKTGDGFHPLAAFYHRESTTLFKQAFNRGEFALHRIISDSGFHTITVPDPTVLRNINLPSDLSGY